LGQVIQYYDSHVLKYRNVPVISKIVEQMLKEAETNKRRDRTVGDIRHRLNNFAEDFGSRRLTELAVQEIKEWVADDDWAPQTRINYLTKISQLFNYGIKHGWAEVNLAARIDRSMAAAGIVCHCRRFNRARSRLINLELIFWAAADYGNCSCWRS
jgi:hypothetical protein